MLKHYLKIVLFSIITISFSSNSATIGITVNTNAVIKATPSSGGTTVSVNASQGVEATVDMEWTSSAQTANYDFEISPENSAYLDTSFTMSIGQWWNDPIEINLSLKPLPTDTAFIPIRTNINAKIIATPLEMISGGVPAETFEFNLTAKTQDTLRLPVETDIITPISNIKNLDVKKSVINIGNNVTDITLPINYLNGSLGIVSMSGKTIGKMNLTSPTKNSLSVWNVANGIYIINIISKNGNIETFKVNHKGGRILVTSNFTNKNSSKYVSSSVTSRKVISRASVARYRFEIQAGDQAYNDTTVELELTGQMNGSRYFYLINPNDTGSNFEQILDSITYEDIFPFRYGYGRGNYPDGDFPPENEIIYNDGDGFFDFYTYGSLMKAIEEMSKIEIDLYQLEGHDYMHRLVWRNKETGETKTMVNNVAYEEYKKTSTEFLAHQIDYASFCQEGTIDIQKRELAAFFANISHETTGQGEDESTKRWGLYWREEVAWQKGSTAISYVDANHATYPPVSGISYHGRGPIQISWNYNYGQVSEFLYGDKNILLNNPDKLIPDEGIATDAFMSAIWFWMTPQAPKPSCHDVMVENWQPTADDIAKGRDKSRFGMTINVINGGQECNKGDALSSPLDRIGFYERYAELMGVTIENYCNCGSMQYW